MNIYKIGHEFFEISDGSDEIGNNQDGVVEISKNQYQVTYWYFEGGSDGRDESNEGVERYFNDKMIFLF